MPSPVALKITQRSPARSVLAWSAWRRLLVVLPAIALLWLAVAWALLDVAVGSTA